MYPTIPHLLQDLGTGQCWFNMCLTGLVIWYPALDFNLFVCWVGFSFTKKKNMLRLFLYQSFWPYSDPLPSFLHKHTHTLTRTQPYHHRHPLCYDLRPLLVTSRHWPEANWPPGEMDTGSLCCSEFVCVFLLQMCSCAIGAVHVCVCV